MNGWHGCKTSGNGMQAWASECVLEMAVPPVAASAYWTLQSAAAMVATQLGTTLRYIMQQHSMWHMAQVGTMSHPVLAQAPFKDPGVLR